MSCRQVHTPASAFMYRNAGNPQISTAALHAKLLQHAGVINSTTNLLYAAFFHVYSAIKNSEQKKPLQNKKTTQQQVRWEGFGGAGSSSACDRAGDGTAQV